MPYLRPLPWTRIASAPGTEPGAHTKSAIRISNCRGSTPGWIFAAGRVVFAAPLTVRGNATIIDHGWGVYSGVWHQSQMLVNVGDMVEQGQVIGLVGGTGRATGAHLHWEVWVNGVQVNPLDWLDQPYP
jgi:hypothetical protein